MDGLNPHGSLTVLEAVEGGPGVGLDNWSARGVEHQWDAVSGPEGEIWRDVNGVLRHSAGIGGTKWRVRLSCTDVAPPVWGHAALGMEIRMTAGDWWVCPTGVPLPRPAAETREAPLAGGGVAVAFRPILLMRLTDRSWSRPDDWMPDRRWSMTLEEV